MQPDLSLPNEAKDTKTDNNSDLLRDVQNLLQQSRLEGDEAKKMAWQHAQQLQQVQAECDQLRGQLMQMESDRKAGQKAQEELSALSPKLVQQQQSIEGLQSENQRLRGSKKALERALQEERQRSEQAMQNAASSENDVAQLMKQVVQLTQKLETEQLRAQAAESELAKNEEDILDLRLQAAAPGQATSQADADAATTQTGHTEANGRPVEGYLREQVDKMEKRAMESSARLSQSQKEVSELQGKVQELYGVQLELRSKIKDLQRGSAVEEVGEEDGQEGQGGEALNVLDKGETEDQVVTLANAVQRLTKQQRRLVAELDTSQSEIDRLSDDNAALQKQVSTKQASIDTYQQSSQQQLEHIQRLVQFLEESAQWGAQQLPKNQGSGGETGGAIDAAEGASTSQSPQRTSPQVKVQSGDQLGSPPQTVDTGQQQGGGNVDGSKTARGGGSSGESTRGVGDQGQGVSGVGQGKSVQEDLTWTKQRLVQSFAKQSELELQVQAICLELLNVVQHIGAIEQVCVPALNKASNCIAALGEAPLED